jgi:hypothetical protein
MTARYLAILWLIAGSISRGPTNFTYVPIPGTNSIQMALMNTFPTGTLTANNALATPYAYPPHRGSAGRLVRHICARLRALGYHRIHLIQGCVAVRLAHLLW